MPHVGPTELVIILVICLLLFGAGKLADVGGALGKSIKEFRKASSEEDTKAKRIEEPVTPPKAS